MVTPTQSAVPDREVLDQVDQVRSSAGFARNERMSRFLQFLVERHLQGRDDELKESVLAVEVFGRRPDYDPKVDSIVRTEAGRLRGRLAEYYAGDGQFDPIVIEIPKGGYVPTWRRREQPVVQQEQPVALLDPLVGSPERLTVPDPQGIEPLRWWSRARWATTAVLAAVGVVALAIVGWWTTSSGPPTPVRIAVLPLANLSQQPDTDYFVDGLTDEIIRNLSMIDGLAVRSRTSSFNFNGNAHNARDAGRQLDADYLLEGSVHRDADHVRVNARVVRVADGTAVWANKFDRPTTDIFAIQDEISLGIVNSLRLNVGRGRRRYETSLRAYDLYLRARVTATAADALRPDPRRAPETPNQRFRRNIEAFEQAVQQDPAFAPAFAGLALVYAVRSVQFPLDHPDDELPKMRAAAERAVELDPLLADAHHARAMAHARDAQWEQAERSFRRAVELDPNQSLIRSDYAWWLLAVLGRYDEALQQLRIAELSDPLSPDVRLLTALVLVGAGRYDEAATQCARQPTEEECMVRVRLGQRRFADAIETLTHRPALLRNPQNRGYLGFAHARDGSRREAERLAEAASSANERALILAGLEDKPGTLDALGQMAALGAQRVGHYLNSPEFDFLRGDAEARAFRFRIGLPAQMGPGPAHSP